MQNVSFTKTRMEGKVLCQLVRDITAAHDFGKSRVGVNRVTEKRAHCL